MTFWELILAIGLPGAFITAVVSFMTHRLEKRIDRQENDRREQESARKKYEMFLVKMLTASTALGKANAIALKNGKCNGETKAALEYLEKVKHEQGDFLIEQGIDHLF